MSVSVKICGLSAPEAVDAAAEAGARFAGFVFYAPSPRAVTPGAPAGLARRLPTSIGRVALTVDADNATLEAIIDALAPDILQLHGRESPARLAELRARFGIPVMKAISVAEPGDVDAASAYEEVCDWLLFDAKPPRDRADALPGGNGLPFDWRLLAGRTWRRPWMLSGGLTADNLEAAVRLTGATTVDVSSGVEDRPGAKSPEKIRALLATARAL